MRPCDQDDFAFAEEAALLVYRLIEESSATARNECVKWAMRSPQHLTEILATLCTLKMFDSLGAPRH